MRVVLLPAVAGRETGQIMTNSRKRHTPEQVVRAATGTVPVERRGRTARERLDGGDRLTPAS